MDTKQLIKAGFDLVVDPAPYIAPQGSSVSPHANDGLADDPASLFTKAAGPGAKRPSAVPTATLKPLSKEQGMLKPPSTPDPDAYLGRRPTHDEISKEQGMLVPGGTAKAPIRNPGLLAPVKAGYRGLHAMAEGTAGNIVTGVGELGGRATDAMGMTTGAGPMWQKARVPYQQRAVRGAHQFGHNRTSGAVDDYKAHEQSQRDPNSWGGWFMNTKDNVDEVALNMAPYVSGGGTAAIPLLAGDAANRVDPKQHQVRGDQIRSTFSPEQAKAFDANALEYASQGVGPEGPTSDQLTVAKSSMYEWVAQGDHKWLNPGAKEPAPKAKTAPFDLSSLWTLPPEKPPVDEGILPPPPPAIPQEDQANAQMQAGAEAAQATQPASSPGQPAPSLGQQGLPSAAQAQPGAAPGTATAVPPAGQVAGAAGVEGVEGAQGGQPAAGIEQLIWSPEPSDDAYRRALEPSTAMSPDAFNKLREAVSNGNIPYPQVPSAVQQLIATAGVEKAKVAAQEQGVPVEQALGQIAQQMAGGDFDEQDLGTAFATMANDAAKQEVEKRKQAGDPTANDPTAVATTEETMKKDPGLVQTLVDMFMAMDIDEQIGLVVGIAGSVFALVNTLMGGSGTTSLISGALGLGGLGYAFGGGDMLRGMMGGQQPPAAQEPPAGDDPAERPSIVGSTPSGDTVAPVVPSGVPAPQAGDPQDPTPGSAGPTGDTAPIAGGADAAGGQEAGPMNSQAVDARMKELAGDGFSIEELQANPNMVAGASDAQLTEMIRNGDTVMQMALWAASFKGEKAQAKLGKKYKLDPQQTARLMELYAQSKKQ